MTVLTRVRLSLCASPANAARAAVVALAVAALGVRLWWALTVTPRPISDAAAYWTHATQLAAGQGYIAGGVPTAYQPVGLPAALALLVRCFGADPGVARVFNAVLILATLPALFVIARRVTGSYASAVLAVLLYGAYPTDIAYTSLVMSEPLFSALSLLAVAIAIGGRRTLGVMIGAGVLVALATLTRLHGAALIPCLVLALYASRTATKAWLRESAAIVLGACLALAPWTLRNACVFRALVPVSTNGGMNVLIGNNPWANGRFNLPKQLKARLDAAVGPVWDRREREIATDRQASRLAREWIAENPGAALALWQPKLSAVYGPDSASVRFSREIPPEQRRVLKACTRLGRQYYAVLLLLGALGAAIAAATSLVSKAGRESLRWLPATMIAAFSAPSLATFGDARFHHPIMPWMTIGVACLADALLRVAREVAARSRPAPDDAR